MKEIVAVEHAMLIAIWNMATTGALYDDPGGDFNARRNPDKANLRPVARCTPTASQAAVNVAPPAINTQNRACISISSFLDDMHNTSDQNGVATTD